MHRRHLQPHERGAIYKAVLEARGVRRGQGGDRRSEAIGSTATVADVAESLGVPQRTFERHVAAADAYDALPPEQKQRVDRREATVKQARRETRREQGREAGGETDSR